MADVNYGSTKEGLFQSALDFLKQKKSLPSKLYRELEEETGFKTEKLEYLISVNTTVAFCDEAIDIFVAHNLVPSHQHLDEDEVIEVEAWELKDLEELIFTGKITDGKTIAAIMAYARKYRSEDKKDTMVKG